MDNPPVISEFIPWPIKLLSILSYLFAFLAWLGGILFMSLGGLGPTFFRILGVICIVIGFCCFFLARGLWKGKKRAKIFYIVIFVIGIISASLLIIDGTYLSLLFALSTF